MKTLAETLDVSPLPAPWHRDDWAAQYREPSQSVLDLTRVCPPTQTKRRNVIYILPVVRESTPLPDLPDMSKMCDYVSATLLETPVSGFRVQ